MSTGCCHRTPTKLPYEIPDMKIKRQYRQSRLYKCIVPVPEDAKSVGKLILELDASNLVNRNIEVATRP